jgi:hypothetical protein
MIRRGMPATQQQHRMMSASAKVWIDKNTRVICQGFTGKQVTTFLGRYLLSMLLSGQK